MKELTKGLDNIILLARGPSLYRCPEQTPVNSEIWGCNTTYRDRTLDRLFVMHDIRWEMIFEDKNFVNNVNSLSIPVYTPGAYPVLVNSVAYPINEVFKEFTVITYFLNVIAYMIALAIMQKPKEISLFGIDMRDGMEYSYERANVEFWLGVAIGRGVRVNTTDESMIFKSQHPDHKGRLFYGYTQRKEKDGLYNLIPDGERKCAKTYRLVPDDTPEEDVIQVNRH